MHGSIPRGCLHSAYILSGRPTSSSRARSSKTYVPSDYASLASTDSARGRWGGCGKGREPDPASGGFPGEELLSVHIVIGADRAGGWSTAIIVDVPWGGRQGDAELRAFGIAVETSSPQAGRYRLGAKSWPWSVQLCHPGGHSGRNRSSQTPLAAGSARPTRWWSLDCLGHRLCGRRMRRRAPACNESPFLACTEPGSGIPRCSAHSKIFRDASSRRAPAPRPTP
jgi:hypothetical protein